MAREYFLLNEKLGVRSNAKTLGNVTLENTLLKAEKNNGLVLFAARGACIELVECRIDVPASGLFYIYLTGGKFCFHQFRFPSIPNPPRLRYIGNAATLEACLVEAGFETDYQTGQVVQSDIHSTPGALAASNFHHTQPHPSSRNFASLRVQSR